MSTPRRSSRIAAKPAVDYTEVKVIEPEPKRVRVSKQKAVVEPKAEYVPPVEDAIVFRDSYRAILLEAQHIRHDLGQARTRADFDELARRCDVLWTIDTRDDISGGMTPMFLSDCMRYCHEAKLGHYDHKCAIDSIKYYIGAIYSTRLWYEIHHPSVFVK